NFLNSPNLTHMHHISEQLNNLFNLPENCCKVLITPKFEMQGIRPRDYGLGIDEESEETV
ncbi:MAG: hypothetical protein M1462_03685, partial [Candidatus Thermoplasmatota archaeon]|nr:hypothetical protein [Candidatus Thermoplasmatota archaeon]